MSIVLLVNCVCVGAALLVAREKQYIRVGGQQEASACGPLAGMGGAFKGMPFAFYILLFVQAMVWLGNTVWGTYGQEWFTNSVYPGDSEAPANSTLHNDYVAGQRAFGSAGQLGSGFNLLLSSG